MPKIEKFPLLEFSEGLKPVSIVSVPFGSKFLKVKLLHSGIFAFYEVPTIIISDGETIIHKYVVCDPTGLVPDNAIFIDMIDLITEVPDPENMAEPSQGLMLFPIYQLLR